MSNKFEFDQNIKDDIRLAIVSYDDSGECLSRIEQIVLEFINSRQPEIVNEATMEDMVKAVLMGNVSPSDVAKIADELMQVFNANSF